MSHFYFLFLIKHSFKCVARLCIYIIIIQGRIQDFKLGEGGGALKKIRRAEEGANILGVFRVKNHYFTPKNHSFYNYGGRREKCWGISCEKSRFYAKKTYFFPILGGGGPLDPPLLLYFLLIYMWGLNSFMYVFSYE